jgi:hypothetical protein
MSTERREWRLVPFARSPEALGLRLEGHLEREGTALRVNYALRGELAAVVLPPPAAAGPLRAGPRRADGLWEHTCFELFLAAEGAEGYWEVNLSPNGDWNLYRLTGYRQGLTPERDREALPFAVDRGPDALRLSLTLPLPEPLARACQTQPLQVAVTAVIEQTGGAVSYWALAHSGAEADFHRREDFVLRLLPEPPLGGSLLG